MHGALSVHSRLACNASDDKTLVQKVREKGAEEVLVSVQKTFPRDEALQANIKAIISKFGRRGLFF